MKTLPIYIHILIMLCITRSECSEKRVTASNGDSYSIVETLRADGLTIYELQKKPANGNPIVLWKSNPPAVRNVPNIFEMKKSPRLSSHIEAMYEKDGEISLLIFESIYDAFVFRFTPTATEATPIVISGLRGDDWDLDITGDIQFKNHNHLKFLSKDKNAENVVSFDDKGTITSDFRGLGASHILEVTIEK